MRQYGGHYKVNGPPVSVPATLDQIIEILPCMPSDLQLHPIKLKCKLEYKSHYVTAGNITFGSIYIFIKLTPRAL